MKLLAVCWERRGEETTWRSPGLHGERVTASPSALPTIRATPLSPGSSTHPVAVCVYGGVTAVDDRAPGETPKIPGDTGSHGDCGQHCP